MRSKEKKIAVIGLGYVGLPLAIEFAKKYKVIGFDIDLMRIKELANVNDKTKEADLNSLKRVIRLGKNKEEIGLTFSSDLKDLKQFNHYIITVPTPINQHKKPDLKPLLKASEMIGKVLKKNDIVIYESTVYPGCTEEDCVPVLENFSRLKFNIDFYCGYSPERINPGDKIKTLTKIIKVTSGSTPEIANQIDLLYKTIITAGTHKAPSIKVAEASKAIENAQRDLNISFVNELALIFDRIGIDTNDVLEAANTKWNFLKFKPGLVGGHCIGVDPYYLTYKAESLGYIPEVIISGRKVNENMGIFVANKLVKTMIDRGVKLKGCKVLLLGITFKENCPDIRNTKIIDVYRELIDFGINVDVHDPHADKNETKRLLNINLSTNLKKYDSILLAVSHNEFLKLDIEKLKKEKKSIIFDLKSFLKRDIVDFRL
jgi:UDP-N-acetyl-D-galactosamine dehydrogenase